MHAIFDKENVAIISPSERQSKHVMEIVIRYLNELRREFTIELSEDTKTKLSFANAGTVYSLPNSANTVRGLQCSRLFFDEMAHFLNGTDDEMWEAVLPMMSRGGHAILISTPFGENNRFHRIWSEENNWNKILINWRECPHLKVEDLKKDLDEASWASEFENAFLGEMDSYLPYELLKKCISADLPIDDAEVHLLGVDFGRKYDLTAIAGVRKVYEGSVANIARYEVRLAQTARNMPFDQQVTKIKALLERINVERCTMDAGGIGMPLAEQLKREHGAKAVPLMFTMDLKQELMTNLKRLMEQGKLLMPNHAPLINSLHAIRLKQTDNKNFVFDSPRDDEIGHADLAWSLALAVHGAGRRKVDFGIY